ncbi:cobalt-precorrin 5A hydrolase [Natranaerobius thermophilus]|uniref:Cobalamin (Vitamin B12) biosynthesis CbiG protein n=1 Tax=Natranaerobius thermophilus (strain ATCC BAA-1301 / DSM 18059 / JW/NM-WN-LF) TaxID=457570 RepID=B2A0F8_NATTJ|nr:cobalamin biosynthesis protein [Natranaerobius thermophilus]ACB84519.1 cobalamin (vitamin B12) biosynthesis CbiG protein [Natranaerobius thermophilus JW/NM-WN-LF]
MSWAFKRISIIAVSREGVNLGLKLFQHFTESTLFIPQNIYLDNYRHDGNLRESQDNDCPPGIYTTQGKLSQVARLALKSYQGIIIIGAAGIALRILAPYLESKLKDPGVVCLDPEGNFSVNFLSGHLGGGSELSREVAEVIGAQAVITNASYVKEKMTPDHLASLWNLTLNDDTDKSIIKDINQRIVNNQPINWFLEDKLYFNSQDSWDKSLDNPDNPLFDLGETANTILNKDIKLPRIKVISTATLSTLTTRSTDNIPSVIISDSCESQFNSGFFNKSQDLILRPKSICIGIGCKRGTEFESILEAISISLKKAGISFDSIRALASVDKKSCEVGLLQAARYLNINSYFYSTQVLKENMNSSRESEFVTKQMGVGGICEPAARTLAGTEELLMKKLTHKGVTVALARAKWPWWVLDPVVERAYQ